MNAADPGEMSAPLYLGDEVSAAGYRLAGARVHTPLAGAEAAALEWARLHSPLVLVSAAVATGIDDAVLREALAAPAPLVLVVPDLQGDAPLPDLTARLRAQLGLEG
jgi:vacuolar-type H+-ATPase subunit F/Vma7